LAPGPETCTLEESVSRLQHSQSNLTNWHCLFDQFVKMWLGYVGNFPGKKWVGIQRKSNVRVTRLGYFSPIWQLLSVDSFL
jgi:hypothetical protein